MLVSRPAADGETDTVGQHRGCILVTSGRGWSGQGAGPGRVTQDDRKGLGRGDAAPEPPPGPQAGPRPRQNARFPTAMARRSHARDPWSRSS